MTHDIRDVVDRGMCVGCGACAVRTSGAIPVTIGRYGVYRASLDGADASAVAAASRVCPFSDDSKNEDALGEARFADHPHDARVGHYHSVFAGRLTDENRLLGSSSGGLTSFLLGELVRTGRVDGVIHVGRDAGAELFGYRVSTTPEQILDQRKSAYYATSVADVVARVRGDGRRYAVVGVPCFVRAFRLLADEMPDLGEQFALFVGLVCGHLKSRFFAESLAWQAGVAPPQLEAIDFRVKNPSRRSSDYDYAAIPAGGEPVLRATKSAIDGSWGYGAFQPDACNFCDDIFAETADIVFADGWLPQYVDDWSGTNLVLVRDPELRAIFDAAHARGEITLDELTVDDAARSQSGNFRHRRTGLRVRLADDAAAGRSIPHKRVEPGYDGIPRTRIAIIRQRRRMSALSLTSFAAARERGDLNLYTRPMSRAIQRYALLDAYAKGPLSFGRALAKTIVKRTAAVRASSLRAATVIAVAMIAAIAIAGYPLYVAPPADAIGEADLIYVIGPPARERIAVERELRTEGIADASLYSVGLVGPHAALNLPVCGEPGVECVHPRPFTTKGEIAYLSDYAAGHDVDRTVILTFTPHVARTRFVLEKCFPGEAVVVAVDQHLGLGDWIYQYAYQTSAFVKAWLTPCSDAGGL